KRNLYPDLGQPGPPQSVTDLRVGNTLERRAFLHRIRKQHRVRIQPGNPLDGGFNC
ncbi:TPA: hypothetical protein QCH59_003591, partial [Enterobacter kobei]|nr:hypothetical protein [Enterobacter kobei]